MAFKEVSSVDADVTTALGGTNRKTGKKNPTQIEGYYLGKKVTVSPKAKSGFANLYIFQTEKGNIGVWGKTDLDRKMQSAVIGAATRVTQSGTQSTLNGDMYKFRVEVDMDNTIEVSSSQGDQDAESAAQIVSAGYGDDVGEETDLDGDEPALDEVTPARASGAARKGSVAAPSADRQARVQQLLGSKRS